MVRIAHINNVYIKITIANKQKPLRRKWKNISIHILPFRNATILKGWII